MRASAAACLWARNLGDGLRASCSVRTRGAGDELRPHFAALKGACAAGLADGNVRVRAAALEAVAALVKWAIDEPEVRLFRDLVPALMQARARAPQPPPAGPALMQPLRGFPRSACLLKGTAGGGASASMLLVWYVNRK